MFKASSIFASLAFAGLTLIAPPSDACSCLVRPIQDVYASSTGVVVGTPLSTWVSGTNRYYQVRADYSFKGGIPVGTLFTVKTAQSSATCGVTFTLNEPYLLNGALTKTLSFPISWKYTLSTGLCSGNDIWKNTSFATREFLYATKACTTNSTCGTDAFCAQQGIGTSRVCRPYSWEGDACGGYTPINKIMTCKSGLDCVDQNPWIIDEPGLCMRKCTNNTQCAAGQSCVSGHCNPPL